MNLMCYRCMQNTVENGVCTVCGTPYITRSENNNLLPLGTTLDGGSIIVGDKLGNGGFGITYIARDRETGLIALKEFMPRHMIAGGREGLNVRILTDRREMYAKALASFQREAKMLSILRHPNIVKILFSFEENNTYYYGMELMQGEDLAHFVRRNGIMSPRDACQLLAPVMEALIFVHSKGVLHRDISPDNVFLRRDDKYFMGVSPCLIDFGAAYAARLDFTQTAPKVKKSGYSPLEQNWDLGSQGPFTDVYAFTAMFYYLITGNVPPPALERASTGLVPASKLNRLADSGLDRVIERGLMLQPTERIQNMKQLRKELFNACGIQLPRESAAVEQIEPPTPTPPPRETEGAKPFRSLIGMLIDWCVFIALPALLVLFLMEDVNVLIGVFAGMLLMAVINAMLCLIDPPGTLGQRIAMVETGRMNDSIMPVVCGSLLRAFVPAALIDWIAAAAGGRQLSHEKMLTSQYNMSDNEVSQSLSDIPDNPEPVKVPRARMRCTAGIMVGKTYEIGALLSFGRDSEFAKVVFPADCRVISARHCVVRFSSNGWKVQDMNSSNGTYVNGVRLETGGKSARLEHGDILKIGNEEFTFENM